MTPRNQLRESTYVLGRLAGGAPWTFRFPTDIGRILISGVSGSGKSKTARAFNAQLAGRPDVAFVGVDLKQGVELHGCRPRFTVVAETPDQATTVIVHALNLAQQRNELIKANGVTQWNAGFGPYVIFFIDELAEVGVIETDVLLAALEDPHGHEQHKTPVRQAEQRLKWRLSALASLGRLGRSAGIYLMAATQYPTVEVVGSQLRSQFDIAWAGRMMAEANYDVSFGTKPGSPLIRSHRT